MKFHYPYYELFKGSIVIGHKPGGRKLRFPKLKNEQISVVLTLLTENEGIKDIKANLEAMNIEWIWFPCLVRNLLSNQLNDKIIILFNSLIEKLKGGNKIYIHCSAGIHRTGMVTYAFLNYLGYDSAKAKELLFHLRPKTFDQIGDNRLLWGEQFSQFRDRKQY